MFDARIKLWQILDKGKCLKSSIENQSKKARDYIKTTAESAETKCNENPRVVRVVKVCIIGGIAAVVAPLVIIPVLSVAGFTSAGVAAGSIAASAQTAWTVSGSVFALCQSAGAVGAVATSTSVGVGLAAGVTAGGVTAAVCKKECCSQNNDEKEQTEVEKEEGVQGDSDEPFDVCEEKVE